jgi:hypothetical protein
MNREKRKIKIKIVNKRHQLAMRRMIKETQNEPKQTQYIYILKEDENELDENTLPKIR